MRRLLFFFIQNIKRDQKIYHLPIWKSAGEFEISENSLHTKVLLLPYCDGIASFFLCQQNLFVSPKTAKIFRMDKVIGMYLVKQYLISQLDLSFHTHSFNHTNPEITQTISYTVTSNI